MNKFSWWINMTADGLEKMIIVLKSIKYVVYSSKTKKNKYIFK